MEVEHLCEFLTIAELESFTLAAEKRFVSQSALSKHIKLLEKEFGLQLFDRTTRHVTLSEAGKLLLPYANKLCKLHSEMLNTIAAYRQQERNSINIISIPVMRHYDITGAIAAFQSVHPHIRLHIIEREPYDIYQLLEVGKCDFAFIRQSKNDSSHFDYITYCEDRLVAVLPKNHALSQEKQIFLNQLSHETFMFLDKATVLYDICYDLCGKAGFTPNVTFTGSRPGSIIDLVSKGMGLSILMKGHIDYYQNSNVTYVDIDPTVESALCLARLKSHHMSPAATLFWDFIKKRGPVNP